MVFNVYYKMLVATGLLCGSCGGGSQHSRAVSHHPRERATAASAEQLCTHENLSKATLLRVHAEGMGKFLSHYRMDPVYAGSEQAKVWDGYQLQAIEMGWEGCLEVGDAIQSINGVDISKPDSAFAFWETLPGLIQFQIQYKRQGQTKVLTVDVQEP